MGIACGYARQDRCSTQLLDEIVRKPYGAASGEINIL
jgi:hypothetical protein